MSLAASLARRVWGELPVYIYAAICGAVCLALYASFNRSFSPSEAAFSFQIFKLIAIVMFFIDITFQLVRQRPQRPLAWARDRYFSRAALKAILGGAPAMLLCIFLIPLFSSFKAMIPLFTDYTWDPFFIELDRKLFLGRDAWEATQWLLGYPLVSAALAIIYQSWLLLLYAGCIVIAFFKVVPVEVKRRFFLTYALSWSLIGGLLATLFASVGPVFAQVLVGIDHFVPQMDYLRAANEQVPVFTVMIQDTLLARFAVDDSSLGSGISAMPSMHVAIAALYWLTMREVGPRAGSLFAIFLVLIWIGSFHLAFHYAADGLVSLAAVAGLWWLSGRVFAWWDRLPFPIPAGQPALRTNTVPAE